MDLDALSRHQLQQLCKEHNIKANLSSKELIALLQTHLASKSLPSHVAERTRAGRTPSANRPLSVPSVSDDPTASAARTREVGRRSRATSRSTSVATAALVPEAEAATVESEKENKRDPVRRKARESQKRLGVGKPRAAGGNGPRSVTRIVPSRGSATGGRTRSRMDPVEEAARMEVVIEEESDEQQHPSTLQQATSEPSAALRSAQTALQPDTSAITRRISAIDAHITQLFTARDTLISKLASQERDIVSIRDDLIVDRGKIIEEAAKLAESRISAQLIEAQAERTKTLELLNAERLRVAKLETHIDALAQRLNHLESRSSVIGLPPAQAITASSSSGPNITQPSIDPAAFLDFSSDSKDDFGPPAVIGKKRSAPAAVQGEETPGPTRASKRARQTHETHTYTTAARLEDALAQPVSPASAPAASSSLAPAPPPPSDTPRTPPMTRHSRRQLAMPPSSPRGGAPTPAQMRFVGAAPSSPTTDSPRKGLKGKGKEVAGTSLLLASPSKAKKAGQTSKSSTKEPSGAVPTAGLTAPLPTASSLLAGVSTPQPPAPPAPTLAGADNARAPSTSPAFPVYEPPSRYGRRGGPGIGLGIGRPSTVTNNAPSQSPLPPPGGLLPAFSFSGRPVAASGQSTADTEDSRTNGTTPGDAMSADEMLAHHQEPITPLLSGYGMSYIGTNSLNDSWNGIHGLTSPEDGPPSPDKRTLYGTELLNSTLAQGTSGDSRLGGFPADEDQWI